MKKFFALLVFTGILTIFSATAFANDEIGVSIEGQAVEFPGGQGAVIVDGRTLVPVRGVFEMLGFDVDWDGDTRTAILTSADYELRITIDSVSFTANGTSYTLDVPAQLIGGRTMVPIRMPLESVGFYLGWDNATRTVLISESSFEEVAQTQAPQTLPISEVVPPSTNADTRIVFVPMTRNYIYHRVDNCGRMNPARASYYPRYVIQGRGYRACERCW
jgi:hypothetical protein